MWTGSRDPFGLRGSREPRGQLGNSKEPIHGPRELFGRPGRPQTAIWIAWETPETDADSPGGSRRAILDCLGGQPGRQRANWVAERHRDSVSLGGPRWATRAAWVAREAPESHLDCLGDSRDRRGGPALRRLQRAIWTAREIPETDSDSPGGSRRLFGQPWRLQRAI